MTTHQLVSSQVPGKFVAELLNAPVPPVRFETPPTRPRRYGYDPLPGGYVANLGVVVDEDPREGWGVQLRHAVAEQPVGWLDPAEALAVGSCLVRLSSEPEQASESVGEWNLGVVHTPAGRHIIMETCDDRYSTTLHPRVALALGQRLIGMAYQADTNNQEAA